MHRNNFTLTISYHCTHKNFTLTIYYHCTHNNFTLTIYYHYTHNNFTLTISYHCTHKNFTLTISYHCTHNSNPIPKSNSSVTSQKSPLICGNQNVITVHTTAHHLPQSSTRPLIISLVALSYYRLFYNTWRTHESVTFRIFLYSFFLNKGSSLLPTHILSFQARFFSLRPL